MDVQSKTPSRSTRGRKRKTGPPEAYTVQCDNCPKPPTGFKRILIPRKDNTRVDVYYMTLCNKRLRSFNDAAAFIKANQAYKDVPLKDFDFQIPKVINDVSVKPSKNRDGTEQSKENDGTKQSKENDGTERSKENDGTVPFKEENDALPSKEDDNTLEDDNTEPSEEDDIIKAYLKSLWC